MSTEKQLIGLMSGTSLDGLDIAHVTFIQHDDNSYTFELLNTQHVPYPDEIEEQLQISTDLHVQQLLILDKSLGRFYADEVNSFIMNKGIDKSKISAICSHGQTIFHQPHNGFTYQIGCGETLAYFTALPVINDFRTKDVAAGGQGAPLVPIGDFSLFSDQAEAFLNIGGFINISLIEDGTIKAFDVCPGNLPLNKLVHSRGLTYDKNGELAKSGEINFFLLDLLNSLEYYEKSAPKSLGTEWLEEFFYPLLKFDKEIESNLRTVVEHIAIQTANVLNQREIQTVLVTGGGARNTFLIDRIKHYFKGDLKVPSDKLIDFKEAIVFAFLGFLNLIEKPNTIPSVTGASRAVIGGTRHLPN
jgi:anhydro-N-acetylmuramic acid kinase